MGQPDEEMPSSQPNDGQDGVVAHSGTDVREQTNVSRNTNEQNSLVYNPPSASPL